MRKHNNDTIQVSKHSFSVDNSQLENIILII